MRRWIFILAIPATAALLWFWQPFAAPGPDAAPPVSAPVARVAQATVVVKVVDTTGAPASGVISALPLAGGFPARNFHAVKNGTQRIALPPGRWVLTACTGQTPEGGAMGPLARKTIDVPASGELRVELQPREGNITVEFELRLPEGKWTSASPFLLPEGTSVTTEAELGREMGLLPHPGAIFGSAAPGTTATRFTLSNVTEGRYVAAVLIQRDEARYAFSVPVELSAAAKQSVPMTAPETLVPLRGY